MRRRLGTWTFFPADDRVVQLLPLQSQVSALSSVQFSPNRVREEFSYDTMVVFPIFQVSQEADGYFPDTSPVTSPDARNIPGSGSLPNGPAQVSWFEVNRVSGTTGSDAQHCTACGGLVPFIRSTNSASR